MPGKLSGSRPPPELLTTAAQMRGQRYAPAHVKQTDALGTLALMCREGQKIHTELANVEGQPIGRLHRIGVQENAALASDLRQLCNGLHGSYLVIGVHHRR